MKKNARLWSVSLTTSLIVLSASLSPGQQSKKLTVRDIMAEPSIAGMRVEGEKLSPDGKWVVYLWSAEGREPKDLYFVSTTAGKPVLLVRAVDSSKVESADKTNTKEEARSSERKQEGVAQRDAAQQAREQSVGGIDWSPDSRRLLYSKGGDLYIIEAKESAVPRRLTRTSTPEAGARWLADGHRIIYQSAGSLFVIDADQTSFIQLTRDGGAAAGGKAESQAQTGGGQQGTIVTAFRPSNDGSQVAYIVSDNSKQRGLIVPDFTGEFVATQTVRRGWSEQRVQIVATDGNSEKALLIKLPPAEGASYLRGFDWSPDDSVMLIDRIDRDTKRRQLFRADIPRNAAAQITEVRAELVYGEIEPKWIAPLSRLFEVSPKGDQFFLASEQDGYNQLFLQPLSIPRQPETVAEGINSTVKVSSISGNADQRAVDPLPRPAGLVGGKWEVNWARWLPNGKGIIYSSTAVSTAERHFYLADAKTHKVVQLEKFTGMNTDPQLSKDGKVLLFQHSEWNRPNDLYSINVCTDCGANQPRQLTDTVPARFREINWTKPEFIEFAAKDGKTIKGRVYTPPSFDRNRKYPAVVFVHGAGYLQNVVNGWNNYYREAMFNHILAQQGYVVLDIDYRGSSGYGRDWRTDVYDFLGGLDLQDHLDGIDYVVKNYGVDPNRVGMYGGSYGGFMSEMAAMRAPEHINCAAALRPVADWKNYYASSPVYTAERLGFPDKNTEAYKRSSPISYADKLSRPLLILHGMVDDNVHFQDSVQLVEKLIELGKTDYFDVMFYPRENHSFTRADSWTDEYQRILNFFEEHLKK